MIRHDFETLRLDSSLVLGGDEPLRVAVERVGRRPEPVLAVGSGADGTGGLGALGALDVRFLQQEGCDLDRPLGELVREGLRFAGEAAARARLERDPALGGVLFERDGQAQLLQRVVPRVESAVVMAGGFGQRLRPLTDDTPKPMLEVAGRVLLFRILDGLVRHGVRRVWISIHHLGERIRDAVGDGAAWGLSVSYLEEDEPLGTGAALAMLERMRGPFFVVNGDLLTTVNFGAMGRAHQLAGTLATIATYRHSAEFPYGIASVRDGKLRGIEEKPIHSHPVNAGMYVFSPEVLELVEHRRPLAMVDFLNDVLVPRAEVACFPVVEYWNDVGTPQAFERAQIEAGSL